MLKITLQIRMVYGRPLVYPADRKAALFCELLGVETLTKQKLDIIKKLGYEIEVTQEQLQITG